MYCRQGGQRRLSPRDQVEISNAQVDRHTGTGVLSTAWSHVNRWWASRNGSINAALTICAILVISCLFVSVQLSNTNSDRSYAGSGQFVRWRSYMSGIVYRKPREVKVQVPAKAKVHRPSASLLAVRNAGKRGPFSPLPETAAPWHYNWDNSIAVCVTMKGENVTDVREWLLYYRWLGVDHVYLTENSDVPELQQHLTDFAGSGFLTYEVEPAPQAQLLVYYRCMERHRPKHNWIAFFDSDEYLVLREENSTLKGVLDDYKHFPGLAVHWIMVGPSGREDRPKKGGVLRHYTRCAGEPRFNIKMIANTYYLSNLKGHPHNFEFRGMAPAVNEARYPIAWRYGIDVNKCGNGTVPKTGCNLVPGSELRFSPDQVSANRIALYHYTTRSKEDYKIKMSRAGGVNSNPKPWSFYELWVKAANKTDEICREPSWLADDCCPEDEYVYTEPPAAAESYEETNNDVFDFDYSKVLAPAGGP